MIIVFNELIILFRQLQISELTMAYSLLDYTIKCHCQTHSDSFIFVVIYAKKVYNPFILITGVRDT